MLAAIEDLAVPGVRSPFLSMFGVWRRLFGSAGPGNLPGERDGWGFAGFQMVICKCLHAASGVQKPRGAGR